MTTALAARLQKAILTLWTQLDVENGCLPLGGCRRLLDELKELLELPVPASYASSAFPLAEAVKMLQATPAAPVTSLPLASATSLAALLAQTINLLAAPLPLTTAYDPSRPTLPAEIISLILHQLAAAKDTVDVVACCLASRSFLPLAREALYHTLYLAIEDQERDDRGEPLDLSNSAQRGSNLAINYGRLASSLSHQPHLGSLVHRMEVSFGNTDFTMDHVGALDVFQALLDTCRPQHIKLRGAAPPEASHFARVLWQSRQRFRGLDLIAFAHDPERPSSIDPALWQLLQEQDTLEDLPLEFDDLEAQTFTSCPFSLKQLHLFCYEPDFPIAPLLHSLTHHSAATLTRLSFPLDLAAKAYTAPKLSHFAHLQEMSLWLRCSGHTINSMHSLERGRCHSLFSALPPSVQSMTLEGHSGLDLLPVVPLDRLPPTLLSLDICAIPFSPAVLLALLHSNSSSQLHRLKYCTMEIQGGRYKSWSVSSQVDVEARLEKRGISSD